MHNRIELILNLNCETEIPERRELIFLASFWGQVNALGTDENDEFTVLREDGRKQGIFKTWQYR